MPHEAGVFGAFGGQLALSADNETDRGFFQSPTIAHLYYSFVANGVQNLSVFVENVAETRSRTGTWSEIFLGGGEQNFPAHISENIHLTSIGLETMRTLATVSNFRLGGGLGLSYGLGGTRAEVVNDSSGERKIVTSCNAWQGLMFSAMVKIKYSIFINPEQEIALHVEGRYWGFPYIGPIGECADAYNGPELRTLHQLGYLAGISFGF
jgi:hypothetical protein